MKAARKGTKSNPKADRDARKDRRSATGMNGSPKKRGLGGKFTWSGEGFSPVEFGFDKEVVDVKDPNFEDPEDIIAV